VDGLEGYLTRAFERANSAAEPVWLKSLRADAFARFRALGFPTTRLEDWKYLSLAPIGRFELGTGLPVAQSEFPDHLDLDVAARIVFVDGRLDRARSRLGNLPKGLLVTSVAELVASDDRALSKALSSYAGGQADGVKALNTALFTDGAWIEADPGVAIEKPIHLVFIGTEGQAGTVRNIVRLGERSELRLIEEFTSQGSRPALSNSVTQVELGKGAILKALKLQREGSASAHLADSRVLQAEGSRYESLWVSLGAQLSRNEIHAELAGRGAECRLLGLYAAHGKEQVDSHTVIDHASPGCQSHETYKGILADESKGSFTGRIVVRKDAQKTDSHQLNRNLLLSERATANTRPQLQIHADDVKCSHGATVGRLDAEQLFYLRSRGIGLQEARRLVSRAFAGEVLEQGGWGEELGSLFDEWLGRL
jgi:Fe-S cluster assembly protein SufD